MKNLALSLLLACLTMVPSGWAAFTPPTPEQIRMAVENPAKLPGLLHDANSEQAANVLADAIREADKLSLPNDRHRERIALLTGHAFVTLQRDASALAKALTPLIGSDDWTNVVAAAAAVSSKGTVGTVKAPVSKAAASAEATPQAGASAVIRAFVDAAVSDQLQEAARQA